MAGRTKTSGLARKRQKILRPAARTADPGKPTAGIAAVEVLLHDVRDDRPEIAVGLLETLVFRDESLEMMEEHPVEDRAFRMARAIDSRHIRESRSRNAPG
jgi:hypothetical protein